MSAKKESLTYELDYVQDLSMGFPQITQIKNPDEGIQRLLEWLGKTCASERAYIFEIYEDETISNTYEWCDEGISPQMAMLQKESIGQIGWWLEMFEQKKPVIIEDIEKIKSRYFEAYATLKLQDIRSLISVSINVEGEIIGFLGIDNPDFKMANQIVPLLFMISNLFSYIMTNRNLMKKINYSDFHDQLTLSLNRNALMREMENGCKWNSLGLVYCNILELRRINSSLGLGEGDNLIRKCYKMLNQVFNIHNIYRTSGDEFIVFCPNIEKWQFNEETLQLEDLNNKSQNPFALGSVWTGDLPIDSERVLHEAEKKMSKVRNEYYKSIEIFNDDWKNMEPVKAESADLLDDINGNVIYHFIEENYFNLETFFRSMSMADHHPYFGDLTTKQWYVSDSMKELMGLETNVVTDLFQKWEAFIPHPEDLISYRNDIEAIMSSKKNVHDLVYRIRDKDSNEYWIRCFGLVKWNKERTVPLFFCGNISKLNYAFMVDQITNFPREKAAIREISKLKQLKRKASFVCFRLNEFSEINELRGRNTANSLLKDISSALSKQFDKAIQFYRLDGLRFLVIMPKDFPERPEVIAKRISDIVSGEFLEYNLPVKNPCVIGILDDQNEMMSAQEVITDIMSLLEIAKKTSDQTIVYSTNTVKLHREQKQMVMELRKDSQLFDNFRCVVQPIVDARTHKIVGGEVLLRWKYNGKDVSPDFFIPALENNNLINHVGRSVFEQAVRHCKRINTYLPDFFVDFNISYNQIYDKNLISFMNSIIKKWQVDSKNLVLELTETHYNDSPGVFQEFIEQCKALGIRMALDDFGVGYSSLEMLLKYPANVVKLDKSLMKKMSDSKEITDFITTIVYACHKFGKLVCVEGVETEQELGIVTEAGCDLIQGFYFHKPLELSDVYDLLTTQGSVQE